MKDLDSDTTYPNGGRKECLQLIAERLGNDATEQEAEQMLDALQTLGWDWTRRHINETRDYWGKAFSIAFDGK